MGPVVRQLAEIRLGQLLLPPPLHLLFCLIITPTPHSTASPHPYLAPRAPFSEQDIVGGVVLETSCVVLQRAYEMEKGLWKRAGVPLQSAGQFLAFSE